MCACMCVRVCVLVYVCARIHECMCVRMCMCVLVHYVCMRLSEHVRVCVCVRARDMCVCVNFGQVEGGGERGARVRVSVFLSLRVCIIHRVLVYCAFHM